MPYGFFIIPFNFMLMCDTFVHIPLRAEHPVIFGKNSDREPNEAQYIVRYPRQVRGRDTVRTTFIEVAHPRDSYEVILSRPFQLWGAEMGANEFGVTIGNEAVFTKMPFGKKNDGLTGMDMIRLALEISKSAREALEHITGYVERYGQDACGGYMDKNFYYHNAFIIADPQEAFVLETAGKFWVFEKVKGYRAISNGLSIESEFDGISAGAIDFARIKGWSKKSDDFNFKKAFSAFLMPKLARCESRRTQSETKGKSFSDLTAADAMQILRSHKSSDFTSDSARPDSICMHATGLFSPHQSTGSMVAELRKNGSHTVWLTGSSSPCLSLYKPFYFGSDVLNESNFPAPGAMADDSYWWQWERFNREVIKNYSDRKKLFEAEQDSVQLNFLDREKELQRNGVTPEQLGHFSQECLMISKNMLAEWRKRIREVPARHHFFYDRFWKQQNKYALAPFASEWQ